MFTSINFGAILSLMEFSLNNAQAKGLAGFFFDVAKGVILGGVGIASIAPLEVKFAYIVISILTYLSLRVALVLLEKEI